MRREVGLWIDHYRTVMVTMLNEKQEIREIRSNIEKHLKRASDSPAPKANKSDTPTAEDGGERKYGDHLNSYYDGVISLLRNADSIWIFGPGGAKVELKKRLELADPEGRNVSVESAGKMTDRQIAAKVRLHYQ